MANCCVSIESWDSCFFEESLAKQWAQYLLYCISKAKFLLYTLVFIDENILAKNMIYKIYIGNIIIQQVGFLFFS